jgi:hypothetical protein
MHSFFEFKRYNTSYRQETVAGHAGAGASLSVTDFFLPKM